MRSMIGTALAAAVMMAAGTGEAPGRGAPQWSAALGRVEVRQALTGRPGGVADEPAGDAVLEVAAPAPWAPQDSADSLYRAARGALSDGEFERASARFREIRERHPRSAYAADALYYEAFALYRVGGSDNLKRALQALDVQQKQYARAATRGDARALAARIRGELARTGDAAAGEEVSKSARAVASSCPRDDDDDERVAALNALLQMDSQQAIPILKRVLARRDECSVVLRRKAVFLLSQKQTAETADALLAVAQNDPDQEVREQAVFWLSQVDSERATQVLLDIMNTSKDRGLQEKALFALSQRDSERGAQALRDLAAREGADEELREKAIFWLGQRDVAGNTEFLRTLYGRLKSETLREKVLFSLSQQGGQGNLKWLLDVAQNANESTELRKKAIFWAGQGGERVSPKELRALYGRLTDRELREQIIFVLSQQHDRTAVDQLMEIARSDRDPELRKKAIFWLGQSGDPRAAEFLLNLIER